MADISSQQPMPTVDESARGTAIIAYILYLIGWPTCHLSTVVAMRAVSPRKTFVRPLHRGDAMIFLSRC